MGINISQMMTNGLRNNITSHREQYDEAKHLSDWQVATALKVSGSVFRLAVGLEHGPIYVPTPTGSGKTTGAVWGIIEILAHEYEPVAHQRICFMTPYQESVDHVYDALVQRLGTGKVGRYHSQAKVNKADELSKQVIIVTHQFLEFNPSSLTDRDLFIIDEAIFATGAVSLKLQEILQARSWATSNNVLPEEFERLAELATEMDTCRRKSDAPYVSAPDGADLSWAKTIAFDLKLSDHLQKIDNLELMTSVQKFCAAAIKGQIFLSKSNRDKDHYDPTLYGADLNLPNLGKTMVLSATAGLLYKLVGPFKQDQGTQNYWAEPSYEQLKLVQLSGPAIKGHYRTWNTPPKRDEVVEYVDWLMGTIPEQTVYLSLPKQVLEGCLREYLGQPQTKGIEYPIVTTKHGKTVFVSHHSLSIGSNRYRDCEAVIYLWDHHVPQAVALSQYHALAGEKITQQTLDQIGGGRLTGVYRDCKEGAYLGNMIQHIGRGRIRKFDDNGIAEPMSVYVFTGNAERFEKLALHYRNCRREQLLYQDNEILAGKGRLSRIVAFIASNGQGSDIRGQVVEKALGFRLSSYAAVLSCNDQLNELKYEFVSGSKGRGKGSVFRYTG